MTTYLSTFSGRNFVRAANDSGILEFKIIIPKPSGVGILKFMAGIYGN